MAEQWLQLVPERLQALERTEGNIRDPLFRFFEREVNTGRALLATVRSDLARVAAVCRGARKATNHERVLMRTLSQGAIPQVRSSLRSSAMRCDAMRCDAMRCDAMLRGVRQPGARTRCRAGSR